VYPNAKAFGYIRGTCGCIQMRRHSDTYGEHAGASKCEGIRIHTGNMRVYPNAKAFGYGEYGGDTTSAGSGTASSEAPTFAALVSRSWREAVATKRLLTPAPPWASTYARWATADRMADRKAARYGWGSGAFRRHCLQNLKRLVRQCLTNVWLVLSHYYLWKIYCSLRVFLL